MFAQQLNSYALIDAGMWATERACEDGLGGPGRIKICLELDGSSILHSQLANHGWMDQSIIDLLIAVRAARVY